jgi:hypothetical protein
VVVGQFAFRVDLFHFVFEGVLVVQVLFVFFGLVEMLSAFAENDVALVVARSTGVVLDLLHQLLVQVLGVFQRVVDALQLLAVV